MMSLAILGDTVYYSLIPIILFIGLSVLKRRIFPHKRARFVNRSILSASKIG